MVGLEKGAMYTRHNAVIDYEFLFCVILRNITRNTFVYLQTICFFFTTEYTDKSVSNFKA